MSGTYTDDDDWIREAKEFSFEHDTDFEEDDIDEDMEDEEIFCWTDDE